MGTFGSQTLIVENHKKNYTWQLRPRYSFSSPKRKLVIERTVLSSARASTFLVSGISFESCITISRSKDGLGLCFCHRKGREQGLKNLKASREEKRVCMQVIDLILCAQSSATLISRLDYRTSRTWPNLPLTGKLHLFISYADVVKFGFDTLVTMPREDYLLGESSTAEQRLNACISVLSHNKSCLVSINLITYYRLNCDYSNIEASSCSSSLHHSSFSCPFPLPYPSRFQRQFQRLASKKEAPLHLVTGPLHS